MARLGVEFQESGVGSLSRVVLPPRGPPAAECPPAQVSRCKVTWNRGLKLASREGGSPDHLDDKVDLDQWVVNAEYSLAVCSRVRLQESALGF